MRKRGVVCLSRFEAHMKSLEYARKNEKVVEVKMKQMMVLLNLLESFRMICQEIKADWNFNVTLLNFSGRLLVRRLHF